MDENTQDANQSVNGSEEVTEETSAGDSKDYAKLYENQKIRAERAEARLKELRRSTTTDTKESATSNDTKSGDIDLGAMAFLTAVGITEDEDIDLANDTAKKWGMPLHKVVKDEDFQAKLERHRTQRANLAATSNIKGGSGTSDAKFTAEYWLAKGVPPTASDVPDRKARVKIARALMDSQKSGKKFYND